MNDEEIRQMNIDAALIELQLVVDDLRAARMRPDTILNKMAELVGIELKAVVT